MGDDSEVKILISSETGSSPLTKLQTFLRGKEFVCELDRSPHGSHCLVVRTVGAEVETLAKLIQSWVKATDGAPIKMEVQQSSAGSKATGRPDLFTLANAVNVLLQANSQALLVQAVNVYPVLLHDDVDQLVSNMIASEEDYDTRRFLHDQLGRLRELRGSIHEMLDAVSPERCTKQAPFEHFALCWEAYEKSALTVFLDRASELAEQIVENGDPSGASEVTIAVAAAPLPVTPEHPAYAADESQSTRLETTAGYRQAPESSARI